jgi:hypothetical protein
MSLSVVIDCPDCATRVSAQVRGAVIHHDTGTAVVLLKCPECEGPLLGLTHVYENERGDSTYESAERLWPAPSTVELNPSIPDGARRDIKDAQKCLSNGIWSAAVVLCGRALERLANEKAPGKSLASGLTELKAQGVIDDRLFQWASALRKERNLGAHAAEEDVSKENAQDVLAFTVAIFEYVYTLSEKYKEFMARKGSNNEV